jgi:hypothetical protein
MVKATDYFANNSIFATKPSKNAKATDARIKPVLKLAFFCSGVAMALLGARSED